MKTHTQTYKENLVKLGKEIDAKVIYTINGVQTELDGDTLGSVTPHYEGAILKSVMKQVDIVSDVDIPLNTEINVQFGLKFDDENYEYVDYGNYIVFSSEKQEDTNNYKIIAYDKMLYAMKDYEQLVGTNLFDKETMIINSAIDSSNGNMTESDNFRTIAFKCQPSTTYTIKKILSNRFVIGYSTDDDTNMPKTLTNIQGSVSHTSETFTTNNDTNYVFIMISKITNDTTPLEDLLNSIQIQEGTSQEIFENIYPITIRDYLNILCTKLNLEFANSNDTFTNYDKEITQELYKDLGYTYRDVLDELAQVTASTICINKDDKLEIRYINDLDNELQEVEGTSLTISDAQDTKLKGVQVEGNTTQNGTPTPTTPIPISNVSGLQEVDVVGKNLFKSTTNTSQTISGVSFIVNSDGTIKAQGTATELVIFELLTGVILDEGTYTWSGCPSGGSGSTYELRLTSNSTYSDYGNGKTFTITSKTAFTGSRIVIRSGVSIDATFKPQLEKGSSATEFEEYKGNTYEINLGKNLYDNTNFTSTTTTGITATNDNGTITCNGTAINNAFVNISTNQRPILLQKGTYTLSANNEEVISSGNSYLRLMDTSGSTISTTTINLNVKNNTRTFTFDEDTIVLLQLRFGSGDTLNNFVLKPQLEKGNATSYSPYFTPIELNKISTYKDYIFKGKGVNLLDVSTAESGKYYSGNYIDTSPNWLIQQVSVKPSTKYYLSGNNKNNNNAKIWLLDENKNQLSLVGGYYETHLITTTSTTKYIGVSIANYSGESDINTIMLNEGESALPYEPYNAKDKWLLHKEIGKVVLNGTGTWTSQTPTGYYRYGQEISDMNNNSSLASSVLIKSTSFRGIAFNDRNIDTSETIYIVSNGSNHGFFVNTQIDTITNFKNWLGNHNTPVYYVLNTPTTTEITNTELISQLDKLEKAKLYQGVTNISSSFPIKFSYASDYETIDEDYIKNTRADFGEKYGPVNSIVLSRSADTDNVYIQDEDSIEENGLCEIKIKDNQILNDNNRSDFLPGLLEQLGGIEYYTNNFESIGITYLDLCDRYKVKIEDNIYDCVMFNNEVEIGDGLNEIIYTDKPEITQTDYKKASKTDKQERQAYLIVDKQNEKIEAFVGDIEGEFASINLNVNGISTRVQGLESNYTGIEGQISGIVSSISEQTSKAITDWFDLSLKTRIENVESTSTTNQEEITKIQAYIRRGVITDTESPYFGQAYVEIGDDTNETTLRILKNRIQFLTNGVETAFISNNQLYINESTILTKEKVGHWATTEDDNGLLNTYWEE